MHHHTGYIIVTVILLHSLIQATITQDYEEDEKDYDDFANINATSNSTLVFTKELTNMTINEGKMTKQICEVKNMDTNNTNRITFNWRHNDVQLDSSDRFKIRTKGKDNVYSSTLRISKLEYFDRGFIECIASNGVDKVRSVAFLEINRDSNKYGSTDINMLKSELPNGDSYGDITTFLPNSIIKSHGIEEFTPILGAGGKSKTFSAPIEFDLDASGKVMDTGSASAPVYNHTEPFCQLYTGHRCRSYLANKYVFVHPPYSQKDIEDKLEAAFLVISQSNDISPSCNKFAEPSICYSAFPVCLDATKTNTYQTHHRKELSDSGGENRHKFKDIRIKLTNSLRRICRDECLLLENELCSKEYSIAKRHLVIGQIMELEICELLPLENESSSKHCLSLGVGNLSLNKDEKCYWDSGKLYRGDQDRAITGETCLRWSHQFHIKPSDHPELAGHNYCRNPGEIEDEPFCFVEQNRKEVCGISKCVYVVITYVGAGVVLVIILLALLFCYCRRKHRINRNLQNKDLPQVNKNIYGNPGPSSPIELNTLLPPHLPQPRNHNSNKNNFQTVPQYTYKEVRFIDELGEGAFGKVYKGELKAKTGKIFVAVKSLKENASAKTQADFQREIELISELKHPNIICLLGVVMKQEPMCMLFEYMSEGDLHEFLIANSPEEGKCLTHDQFLDVAIQIAQGMEYLSGNHYVHRDLAARNCLVSKDLVVKISDFGLSRDMYSCDYYRVQSKSLLPVRWMPPESILYGKFTTESDVWSYGVVLWEIYSYGLQPYYGYNNQEVINMIRSRKLLPCPDACPSYCYALMVECWAEQANRRPNFSEIAHRLKVWKQSGCTNGAYFKTAPTPHKYSQSSKSSHTSDSQTLCPTNDTPTTSFTWERDRHKPGSSRLHDSQSSLTSRTSSLGNTTQSTNISNDGLRRERRTKKTPPDSFDKQFNPPKNIVVRSSGTGDAIETKISL